MQLFLNRCKVERLFDLGIQRKTGKHVAVKVIDKQKFPSNKEAALRTEVEILQAIFYSVLNTEDC